MFARSWGTVELTVKVGWGQTSHVGDDQAVEVRGLRVVRGKKIVLDDFDLDIAAGQITGLLGPSGCGKSTLMRAMVGVQRIAGGTVTVLGLSAGCPPLRSRVGYLAQQVSIYEDLTVEQNLVYFAKILGCPTSDVDRVIDEVDLFTDRMSMVGALSGGERSRASLAVALLGQPELLVLDEPTVGLDPVLRRDLWNLFADLAASGKTLLISSHVMDEAARCDRLILMRDGQMLAHNNLGAILEQTRTQDVEQAFLALVEGGQR